MWAVGRGWERGVGNVGGREELGRRVGGRGWERGWEGGAGNVGGRGWEGG